MSELRKIQVSTRRIEPFVGYFHQWFSKVYDDGSSRLYAIIEKEEGQVSFYDLESYTLKFVKEEVKDISYFEPT